MRPIRFPSLAFVAKPHLSIGLDSYRRQEYVIGMCVGQRRRAWVCENGRQIGPVQEHVERYSKDNVESAECLFGQHAHVDLRPDTPCCDTNYEDEWKVGDRIAASSFASTSATPPLATE
jgi:hypothetical protein